MREKTPTVSETPGNAQSLIDELHSHADNLNVAHTLTTFSGTLRTLTRPSAEEQARAYYYLLRLNAKTG
jgi:hypothetical protein